MGHFGSQQQVAEVHTPAHGHAALLVQTMRVLHYAHTHLQNTGTQNVSEEGQKHNRYVHKTKQQMREN